MAADGPADDEEIVASGEALRTVAGWLGVSDAAAVMQDEGLSAEFEAGRPQGLGLGAKYLPHSKALALMSGVEQRLSSKLRRSAERAAKEGGGGGGGHHASPQFGRHPGAVKHAELMRQGRQQHEGAAAEGKGQGKAARQAGGQQQQAEEGDSEDDEARGRAFGKGAAAARPQAYSRADLLKPSGAGLGKKKRKRGGGGQQGG